MIEDAKHDSKRSLAELLDNLVAEAKMLVVAHHVLLLVCVESMVQLRVYLAIGRAARQIEVASILNPLVDVEEVDYIILHNLTFLTLP